MLRFRIYDDQDFILANDFFHAHLQLNEGDREYRKSLWSAGAYLIGLAELYQQHIDDAKKAEAKRRAMH